MKRSILRHSDLSAYPNPEQCRQRILEVSDTLGAQWFEYGVSVQGRALLGVRIPCTSESGTCKKVLLCANIHGQEWITTYVAIRFLESFMEPESAHRELLQQAEVWVLPCLNPDGYARTWEVKGASHIKDLRTNANGVDLNRNFPLPEKRPKFALALGGWGTGSSNPKNTFYRGISPLSEPETAALDTLFTEHDFWASASLHSFLGTFFTPHVKNARQFRHYGELCKAFRKGQKYKYTRVGSRVFDWFTGEQEDYQHHHYDTWAICVENFPLWASYRQFFFAPTLFWRFNPKSPEKWAQNDIPGLLQYFLAALDSKRPSQLMKPKR